ncbi:MAG: methylmalonyl Co-A mutase-associated GTPase MeaB, partial [Planctomycetaceae bacterium]|nr:methylmalonyl Co-A mutase-associated GTPase MeaB [Planctomycetaceae bacterium]
ALKMINIDAVWGMVLDYYFLSLEKQAFETRRAEQNRDWMHQLVNEMLMLTLSRNPGVKAMLPGLEQEVAQQTTTPYAAAKRIMDQLQVAAEG